MFVACARAHGPAVTAAGEGWWCEPNEEERERDDDDDDDAAGSALPVSPTGGWENCAADDACADDDEDDDDDDDDDDDVAERSGFAAALNGATARGGTDPCDTPFPPPWLTSAAAELDRLVLGGGISVGAPGAFSGGCNAGEFPDDVAAAWPLGGSARPPLRSCMMLWTDVRWLLATSWVIDETCRFSESSL